MPAKTRKSPNGTPDSLTGFRLPPVYEWTECEKPDVNEGLPVEALRVRVLVNPTRAEIIAQSQAFTELQERIQQAVKAATEAVKDGKNAAAADRHDYDREMFDLIAPRITEWNMVALNDADEVVPLPPPAEAGGAVIALLPQAAQSYLIQLVSMAHHGGEMRSKLSRRPETMASTEVAKTPSGPQVVDIPTGESRQSRRTS